MKTLRRSQETTGQAPPGWDEKAYRKAARRVHGQQEDYLLAWAESASSSLGHAFSDFIKVRDPASLAEIELALTALWALSRELRVSYEAATSGIE